MEFVNALSRREPEGSFVIPGRNVQLVDRPEASSLARLFAKSDLSPSRYAEALGWLARWGIRTASKLRRHSPHHAATVGVNEDPMDQVTGLRKKPATKPPPH